MIKTGSADKAAENLAFLVQAGLIESPTRLSAIRGFLETRQPGSGPTLPSGFPVGEDRVDTSPLGKEGIVSVNEDPPRRAQIDFINKSKEVVRIYWFDYAGNPIFTSTLQPGREYWVDTYFGHQFVVTNAQRKAIAKYTATAQQTIASIPPQ
jgi:hypothetical protein